MVRGKYPVEVEFGPKALLNLQSDSLFLEDIQFNNISDTHLLETSLQKYKERFGRYPTQLAADRGFWSKENRQLAQDYGIKKIAIENKGKSSYLKGKPFRERLRRLRCKIEAKISLAKRKYGLNRCLYSIQGGEEIWARLGLLSMNLKMAYGSG
jgi:transposase, IS5 family